MNTCFKCGTPYRSLNSKYCSNCGTARDLAQKNSVCSSCGSALKADDRYCHECGARTEVGKQIEDLT